MSSILSAIGGWVNGSTALLALLIGSLFWGANVLDQMAGKRPFALVIGAAGLLLLVNAGWAFGRVMGLLLLAVVCVFLVLTYRKEKRRGGSMTP